MKLTTLTTSSNVFFKSVDIFLDANDSLCMQQWFQTTAGATALTKATSPLILPDIARAPSVLIPIHFDHSISFLVIKLFKLLNKASAVVHVGSEWQNNKSCILLSNSYRINASKLSLLETSVLSSNCSE